MGQKEKECDRIMGPGPTYRVKLREDSRWSKGGKACNQVILEIVPLLLVEGCAQGYLLLPCLRVPHPSLIIEVSLDCISK
jgi:hypothetical protein